MAPPLTIMFWPESAYGPTNQCIGLAAILRDRGHTIVFAAESSWAGKLSPFGFVEELVDLAEPPEGASDEDAGVLARAIVRLAMSYVSMPPEADHDVARDLARLMTPFAERYGVIDTT